MSKQSKLEVVYKLLEKVLPVLDDAQVDKKAKALVVKTMFQEVGIELDFEIEDCEHFYNVEQIAKELNIYTKSGKPAMTAIGAIIEKIDIEECEKKIVWESNGSWQGTVEKFAPSVVLKIQKWLQEQNYPDVIEHINNSQKAIRYCISYKNSSNKLSDENIGSIYQGQMKLNI